MNKKSTLRSVANDYLTNPKKNKGITLIALVITIIVMIILLSISISMLFGEDGLIFRAVKTMNEYLDSQEKEQLGLAVGDANIMGLGKITNDNLIEAINEQHDLKKERLSGNVPWLYQGRKTYTIDQYGTILEGIYSTWDGKSQELPEIKNEKANFNWYIYTCAQLKFLEQFVNNGNKLTDEQRVLIEGIYDENEIILNDQSTIYLMANLDFGARELDKNWKNQMNKEREWIPIGKSTANKILAKVKGNNYIINGVFVDSDTNTNGVFGNVTQIDDITVQNSYIEGRICTGGLVGYAESMSNCHNVNTTVILKDGQYHTVGGVAGYFQGIDLKNCTNRGEIKALGKSASNNSQAGGIVGYAKENTKADGCINYGKIYAIGNRVGGLIGQNNANIVKNCSNYGDVESKGRFTGGIAGYSNNVSLIEKCCNYGEVSSEDYDVGGITGICSDLGKMDSCTNYGKIISINQYTGGMIGYTNCTNIETQIDGCNNKGEIEGGATTGGIVGFGHKLVSIINCENDAKILSGSNTSISSNSSGGIAGSAYGIVNGCINKGEIIANKSHRWNRAGGMVGFMGYDIKDTSINNCSNLGDVKVLGESNYMGVAGGMIGDGVCTMSITNCYNSGNIYGEKSSYCYIGGLLGRAQEQGTTSNEVTYTLTLTNSYSKGNVEANQITAGLRIGMIGGAVGLSGISNSYYYKDNENSLKALNGADYENEKVYGIDNNLENFDKFHQWQIENNN